MKVVFRFLMGLVLGLALQLPYALPLKAANNVEFGLSKDYWDLTPAERTAAKRAARKRKFHWLVVCADPGNMPLSNNRREGFQNKIAEVLASKMGARLRFFWRPYLERGLTRETFANNECDILMGMPEGYEGILTTMPIYRSTYVLAYRSDSGIKIRDLDDPKLKKMRVGVFQHSGLREALARHGIKDGLKLHIISHDGDLRPENQPWRQVQQVIDGELDIAGVWGPFAGWLVKMKKAPLVLQPVNLMDDVVPLEFSLTIGMRSNNVVLKYALDNALVAAKDEIEQILRDFGVPLVQCSNCVVQGDLPSHGSYYKRFVEAAKKRFLASRERKAVELNVAEASPDQIVDRKRLESWLKNGSSLTQELANAVLASDMDRVKLLVAMNADINALDPQGFAPLHTAARFRDSDMIELLLELGADPNVRDGDGWTPLLHAAFRNHVPSVNALVKGGADLEAMTPEGFTPLAVAIEEEKYYAVQALLKAGANPNTPSGPERLTPLMVVASKRPSHARTTHIIKGAESLDIARELIARGADVNARSTKGVTALMVAAGFDNAAMIGLLVQKGADLFAKSDEGRTAIDIARDNLNDAAVKSLRLLAHARRKPVRAHTE